MTGEDRNWKLLRLRRVSGQIEVVTGLRIGASQDTMEISGLDNPIIRNPADEMPYIPGSSLKGRMRSLAEWYLGEVPPDGEPTHPLEHAKTARVFGISAQRERVTGPTRLVVRDAFLTDEWKRKFSAGESVITEVKHENSINRLTSMANPRPMERVVPGVRFSFELVYRILDVGDGGAADEANFDRVVLLALALVQADCLGSCGSRGCGQVRFVELRDESGQPIELPRIFDATEARTG
ncbi:MAG: type III-A CRISPR-associated RAMP protein Csm3 [Planctomycetota bacterium]